MRCQPCVLGGVTFCTHIAAVLHHDYRDTVMRETMIVICIRQDCSSSSLSSFGLCDLYMIDHRNWLCEDSSIVLRYLTWVFLLLSTSTTSTQHIVKESNGGLQLFVVTISKVVFTYLLLCQIVIPLPLKVSHGCISISDQYLIWRKRPKQICVSKLDHLRLRSDVQQNGQNKLRQQQAANTRTLQDY